MHIDAGALGSGARLSFDVCIIGAGPAGITVARRLAGQGLRIALVEAGGFRPTIAQQQTLRATTSGTPYWKLQNVRVGMVGGSANRWGGICRPLDPNDLEPRDWVANSGWPIAYAELARHYGPAARELGIDDEDFNRPPADAPFSPVDVPEHGFENIYYRISPQLEYGRQYRDELLRSSDITLVTQATVTKLQLSDRERIGSAEVCSLHGQRRFNIDADRFVVAAGGVENARLLLASDSADTRGLGNQHDVVGRYFMEHVHAPIAHFVPNDTTRAWSSYGFATSHLPKLTCALAPTAALQRSERLLTASLAIGPVWYSAKPPFVESDYRLTTAAEWGYRALRAGGPVSAKLAAGAFDKARVAWNMMSSKDFRRRAETDADQVRAVYYRGEQAPYRDNRVTLGGDRDRFGQRLPHLHWTVGASETANAELLLARFASMVEDNKWGSVSGPHESWTDQIVGGPHHLGTTRMSSDPTVGVVDPDLKVHGIDNLWITGSSVFPTGGHANPTLTVMALSIRLAEHLLIRPRVELKV